MVTKTDETNHQPRKESRKEEERVCKRTRNELKGEYLMEGAAELVDYNVASFSKNIFGSDGRNQDAWRKE